jgi:hypothetical protein
MTTQLIDSERIFHFIANQTGRQPGQTQGFQPAERTKHAASSPHHGASVLRQNPSEYALIYANKKRE